MRALLCCALVGTWLASGCGGGGDGEEGVGEQGGPCYPNGTCNAGLICSQENICIVDDADPCDDVDCGSHGDCAVMQDEPICVCDDGYHAEGLSCVEDAGTACEDVDCGPHGSCAVDVDGNALCVCDAGYHAEGLSCVEDAGTACEDVDCGPHGSCAVDADGNALCVCDAGYHAEGLSCVADESCPVVLEADFESGMAPFGDTNGLVSVVDGRLRMERPAYTESRAVAELAPAIGGEIEVAFKAELLTNDSRQALALRDMAGSEDGYYVVLQNETQNGSQAGLFLFFNSRHGNHPGSETPLENILIEHSFDPPAGTEYQIHLTRTAAGDFELFLDGSSVGSASDDRLTAFDTVWLNAGQDSVGGHGGFFDDIRITACATAACDLSQVEALADLPRNLRTIATRPRDGAIYLVGGYEVKEGASTQCLANVWRYDMAGDSIQDLGAVLPYARCPQGNAEMTWGDDGKLYIAPGLGPSVNNGWGSHRCVIVFDPAGPSASEAACFPSNRWNMAALNGGDGYIYFLGGWNGGSIDDIWRYDPAGDELTNTGATIDAAGNRVSSAILEHPDGVAYLWTSERGGPRLVRFDPADLSFATLVDVEPYATNTWLGADGAIHSVTGTDPRFSQHLIYNIDSGTLDVEALGANIFGSRSQPAFSADTTGGHLYAFGGPTVDSNQPTATVERTTCLP